MNLDDQIANFLADADARPTRSKLEPYAELIRELRQRRWTFRKIADALRERFAVTASPSTIHDFTKVRARRPGGNLNAQPEPPQPRRFRTSASKPPRSTSKCRPAGLIAARQIRQLSAVGASCSFFRQSMPSSTVP